MIAFVLLAETSIQLVPDGTIFVHIALILIMVAVLNRTLLKPINEVLGERERMGAGTLAESVRIQEEFQKNLNRYEMSLRTARAERYRLAEVERKQELERRQQRIESAKAEINKMIEAEKGAIRESAVGVRSELASEAVRIAATIEAQILKPLQESDRVN